jgi:hypothetical protein
VASIILLKNPLMITPAGTRASCTVSSSFEYLSLARLPAQLLHQLGEEEQQQQQLCHCQKGPVGGHIVANRGHSSQEQCLNDPQHFVENGHHHLQIKMFSHIQGICNCLFKKLMFSWPIRYYIKNIILRLLPTGNLITT